MNSGVPSTTGGAPLSFRLGDVAGHAAYETGAPLAGLLFLGIILTFATVFEVGFFSSLPKGDPGRNLLLVVLGGRYIPLLLCSVIIVVVWIARKD